MTDLVTAAEQLLARVDNHARDVCEPVFLDEREKLRAAIVAMKAASDRIAQLEEVLRQVSSRDHAARAQAAMARLLLSAKSVDREVRNEADDAVKSLIAEVDAVGRAIDALKAAFERIA